MSIANSSPPGMTLAPEIAEKLRGVRGWSLLLGLIATVAASLGVLLGGMLLAMLIDWWTLPENGVLRPWLTSLPILAASAVLVVGSRRVIARQRVLWRAATEVDRTHPELDQRWTTLARAEGESHPAMHRKLTRESVAWVPRVAPAQVAPKTRLWHAGWILTPAFALLLAFFLADSQRAGVLVSRFLAPSKNITMTRLTGVSEGLVAARGESLDLSATIEGRIPNEARLEIRKEDGKTRSIKQLPEAAESHRVSHTLREVREPVEVRWLAGDGRSEWTPVTVADRPKIESVRLRITPPTYTKRKPVTLDRLPRRQRVIEGSLIELSFQPKEPVDKCQLIATTNGSVTTLALSPVDDGWYVWSAEAIEDTSLELQLVESHGLAMRKPATCKFQVVRDRAPSVEVISPDNEMAVQPDEQISIEFLAKDDFAITHADLVVYGENAEGEASVLRTVPIDLGEQQGNKKVKGSVPLDLTDFDLENGQSISYAVRVYDNREAPNPTAQPPVIASAPEATQPTADDSEPSDAEKQESPIDQPVTALAQNDSPQGQEAESTAAIQPQPSAKQTAQATPADKRAPAASESGDPTSDDQPSNEASTKTLAATKPADQPAEPASPDSTPPDASTADRVASKPPKGRDTKPTAPTDTPATNESKSQLTNADKTPTPPKAPPAGADQPSEMLAKTDPSKPTGKRTPKEPAAEQSKTPAGKPNPAPPAGSLAKQAAEKPDSLEEKTGEDQPPKPENASATSDAQRLVAGLPKPPEAEKPTSEKPSEKQVVGGPSNRQSPTKSAATNAKQASARASQKSGKVAVPEGMVALNNSQDGKPREKDQDQQPQDQANGAPRPGNEMTRRLLDTPRPQSAASNRMRLKVDEWAGSFDGQVRDKLAIAISPVLAKLDSNLTEAQEMTGAVAERVEAGEAWQAEQKRTVSRADRLLEDCEEAVEALAAKTRGTPYAFVGLQLGTIVRAHLPPARESLWEARETEVGRAEEVRIAWGEIAQARTRIAELTKSFERIHREHRLAEATAKVKKMYQVFIEDSLALLTPEDGRINNYQRRLAELEMDDEYLKRLKEVLELQRDMQAELARLLTDDPRLMRRYLDRLTTRNDTLRDQATLLAERQKAISQEAKLWAETDESKRPALLEAIRIDRLSRLTRLAELATLHNERLEAWAPLENTLDDPTLAPLHDLAERAASEALKLAAMPPDQEGRLAEGRKLYATLGKLDAAIRRVEIDGEDAKLATHLLNRLAEVRELTLLASSWIRQTDLLEKGEYWQEAAIEQYKLAMESDTLAGKLAGLERQLAGALPPGSEASDGLAAKANELLTTFDNEVSANQLAATFAMRRGRDAPAVAKTAAADTAFQKVERLFDELMRATLDELDKLPVQDPIAQLLRDPTLDELLAQLENETPLQELLGIPARPSNLRIIGDWMRPGNNGGGGGGMIAQQLRLQAQAAKRQAQEAYRRALARAKKAEKDAAGKKSKRVARVKRTEWNTLLSSLRDDLLQGEGRLPPEEYREAIEYYLTRISRLESQAEPAGESK